MITGLPTAPLASRLIEQRAAAPWITLSRKASTYQPGKIVQTNGTSYGYLSLNLRCTPQTRSNVSLPIR